MALRLRRSTVLAFAFSALFACACGPSANTPPAASPEPAPEPVSSPTAETPPEPPPAEEASATAASDAAPEEAEPAPAATPAESEGGRSVRYVVNPEGMRVRVAGVVLVPKAELVERAGTVSVKLKVEASAEDGKKHSLLAPAGKELAFAAKVRRSDGSEETFTDQREGEREVVIDDGKDAALSRTFPEKGFKPLKNGDELELSVGLWGLGDDAESRRPLRALCKVTLTYPRKKPRLKLTPPDGVGK